MVPLILAVVVLTLAVRPLRELAGTLLSLAPIAALVLGALYVIGVLPVFADTHRNVWVGYVAVALLVSVPLTRVVLVGIARLVGPRTAAMLHLPVKAA